MFPRKQTKLRVLTFHELTEVRVHKVKESLKVLVLEHYAASAGLPPSQVFAAFETRVTTGKPAGVILLLA